jgi:hypothetical protein
MADLLVNRDDIGSSTDALSVVRNEKSAVRAQDADCGTFTFCFYFSFTSIYHRFGIYLAGRPSRDRPEVGDSEGARSQTSVVQANPYPSKYNTKLPNI